MSLQGNAKAENVLRGQISGFDLMVVNAYDIAVKNGFKGTEAEWLASLKGVSPKVTMTETDYGYDMTISSELGTVAYPIFHGEKGDTGGGSTARIAEVSLLAANWIAHEKYYSQVVTIAGVTENSQVDLTPSVEQLAIFYDKDLSFVTENEGGTVTVYAIGQKPENDYVMQATIKEVTV